MDGDATPFRLSCVQFYLHLPPVFANDVNAGIRDKLNAFLMRYDDDLEGVLLAYTDIQFPSSMGRILYDCPFVHFKITASCLLFQPRPGTLLEGVVNKQSEDHVGLLAFGVFNASLAAVELRHRYAWDDARQCWVSSDNSATPLLAGHRIAFQVVSITVKAGIVGLSGQLASQRGGATAAVSSTVEGDDSKLKKKERKEGRKKDSETEDKDEPKKKKRKRASINKVTDGEEKKRTSREPVSSSA